MTWPQIGFRNQIWYLADLSTSIRTVHPLRAAVASTLAVDVRLAKRVGCTAYGRGHRWRGGRRRRIGLHHGQTKAVCAWQSSGAHHALSDCHKQRQAAPTCGCGLDALRCQRSHGSSISPVTLTRAHSVAALIARDTTPSGEMPRGSAPRTDLDLGKDPFSERLLTTRA
jgi:hypothetical protein